ncbi:MAG: hypothetical protein J6I61_08940 [Prevotella sp.]|nr:hypothetical protein [Prevotella sp.]
MNHLLLIIRHPSPASLDDMPALVSRLWSRKGYVAMTVFGYIFTSRQSDADYLNNYYGALKNHEMIHLRQAQSTHNSWVLFYLRYFWFSVLACRYFRKQRNAVYYLNPFEIEAYTMMHDLSYLDHCREHGAQGWRLYARMSLRERMEHIHRLGIGTPR